MTLYSYDIASAYPYAMAQLSCLRPEHGRWVHLKKERDLAKASLETVASYRIAACRAEVPWGPLPHRGQDGNIIFPVASEGGWAWLAEFQAGQQLHSGVKFLEAWSWQRKCCCPPPFQETVTQLFNRRLLMGKASQGLVVKLALNSGYGVSAQSAGGGGRFRCMVRAGFITSMTRAMLLRAVLAAGNPWNVLELATDSILSRVPLSLPAPINLGTHETAERLGKAPLGAWEAKELAGVFLIRPGLRFELGEDGKPVKKLVEDAELKGTAARGMGTKVLHQNRSKVLSHWEKDPMADVRLQQPSMFHNSKQTVRKKGKDHAHVYARADYYGTWTTPKPRLLSYSPAPKRAGVAPWTESSVRLLPHAKSQGRSAMYSRGGELERDGYYELLHEVLEDSE